MRSKLVAGNWKMHGSLTENAALLTALRAGLATGKTHPAAVCVPFPYLGQAQQALQGGAVAWGAQDVSEHAKGAFTGEVSAAMLRDLGCRYVIVGHSERRALHHEGNSEVGRKMRAAQSAGLTPIVCVGETLAERESGVTERVVGEQLGTIIAEAGVAALAFAVVAYEPVWAIGTGKTATPEQAQAVHAFTRGLVASHDRGIADKLLILYGGSVKAANAQDLFAMPDIDGGLVGGASLDANEFLAICRAGSPERGELGANWTKGAMEILILAIHVLVGIAVCGLVLLQHGKGADMGAAFGSGSAGSLFGASGSANFLSRATGILATVFFITSLGLTYIGTHRSEGKGVIDRAKDSQVEKKVAPKASEPPAAGSAPAEGASRAGEVPK